MLRGRLILHLFLRLPLETDASTFGTLIKSEWNKHPMTKKMDRLSCCLSTEVIAFRDHVLFSQLI